MILASTIYIAREEVRRDVQMLNELRWQSGLCIRQDPYMTQLCDKIREGLLRLKTIDTNYAPMYEKAIGIITDYPKAEKPRLHLVA